MSTPLLLWGVVVCRSLADNLRCRAVSLAVNYTGAEDFAATEYESFVVGGEEYGKGRQFGNLAFLRVYGAGHFVQLYQPLAMLEFFNRTIHGLDIATGLEDVSV